MMGREQKENLTERRIFFTELFPKRGDQGFTLVEVLVASGLMAVIGLALASVMSTSQRAVQSTTAITDFNSLVNTIQSVIGNSTNCATALGVNTLTPPPPIGAGVFPQPLQTLYSQGTTGVMLVPAATPAAPVPFGNTLSITNFEFSTATPLGAPASNQYIAALYLAANKVVGNGGAVGSQTLSHTFNIVLTVNPASVPTANQITLCSGATNSLWQLAANGVDIYYAPGPNVGNVGIGTTTPGNRLTVPWELGDTAATATFGSSNPANNQNAIVANSYSTDAIRGLSWTGLGLYGYSTTSTAVYGHSIDSNGVYGSSDNNNSGYFKANTATNPLPTLVTQQWLTGTGDLFQAENAAGASLVNITSSGNVGIGTVATNGSGTALAVSGIAASTAGGAWAVLSDIRLKDIRSDYEYGLGQILKLHTVRFNYKKSNPLGLPSDNPMTGVIAQEVEKIIPDAVHRKENGYLELNADPIHWAVVNAVKEFYGKFIKLVARVDEHDTKIDALAHDDAAIKATVESLKNIFDRAPANIQNINQIESEMADLKRENTLLKAYFCDKDPSATICK